MTRKYEKTLERLTEAIKDGTHPNHDQLNMSKSWIMERLKIKIFDRETKFGDEWILQGIIKDLEENK